MFLYLLRTAKLKFHMGTWNTSIDSNDTFLDIYSNFFTLYNQGQHPSNVSKQVVEMFEDEFTDIDTRNNALFGLALAQWKQRRRISGFLMKLKG
ncbi:hypothetical protein AB6735_21535 [Mucilaginibacter sp. RCC_168]|uniref:hypothetical protein n=1 Tax=Mucilaginibacter sp. RCC_168 TaxID=3239221 RepID=UPI0035234A2E